MVTYIYIHVLDTSIFLATHIEYVPIFSTLDMRGNPMIPQHYKTSFEEQQYYTYFILICLQLKAYCQVR
jgi:hypothetical protein